METVPFFKGFVEKPPSVPKSQRLTYDSVKERSNFSAGEVSDPLLMSPTMIGQTWTDESH